MMPGRRFVEIFRRSTVYSSEAGVHESVLRRFWRESLSKAIIPMLVILGLITVLKSLHMFDRMEVAGLDYFVRTQARPVPRDIFLVEISDDDYKNSFHSTSPLDPDQVLNIIEAVQSAGVSVIGMDLDTRGNGWRTQCVDSRAIYQKVLDPNSNVVWALVPAEDRRTAKSKNAALFMQPVLGGRLAEDSRMGVVRFPVEIDGSVRRYHENFEIQFLKSQAEAETEDPGVACDFKTLLAIKENSNGTTVVKAFPHAVASVLKSLANPGSLTKTEKHEGGSTEEEHYIAFPSSHYQFQTIEATEFLKWQNLSKENGEQQAQSAIWNKVFHAGSGSRPPVILIGGTFEAARDAYRTPVGDLDGLELLATAVESEINPEGVIREFPLAWEIVIDILLAVGLVWIYFRNRYHPWRALVYSVAVILFLPFLVSLSIFWLGGLRWLSFVPIGVGMLIHQLIESAGLSGELHEKLQKAHGEVRELKTEIEKLHLEIERDEAKEKLAEVEVKVKEQDLEALQATINALKAKIDHLEKPASGHRHPSK
jgi:CHASE2 domain-containing sensor protein